MNLFDDEYYMRKALMQAEIAYNAGEVPIGAIAVKDGLIIGKAYNQVEMLQDPTAHAEILLITQVAAALKNWRLEGVEIYVTKEPCAMCAGAMVNARVKKVIIGLSDSRSGGAGGALDITGFKGMLHIVEVKNGVLEEESKYLIQSFFKKARLKDKNKIDL